VFPRWYGFGIYPGLVLVGTGMGPASLSFILSVQHAVKWGQRGVATGAVILLRTIGGALGVGLLGAVLGWEVSHRLDAAGGHGINVPAALRPETHHDLSAGELALVQEHLGHALRDVYVQMAVLGIAMMLCALGLPNQQETHASAADSRGEDDADDEFAVAAAEL
jgi:hypothetical protein